MTAYGIDFGTTNSALAVINNGEIEIARIDNPPVEWDRLGYDKVFPSVFGFGDNREALFGWDAKLSNTDTKLEAVKRLFATEDSVQIGDEQFLVDEIATMLFSQIKRSAASESGLDVSQAVVTVPANSRGKARQRTKLCAGMGGINVLALINEPTAAAMAATRRNREDQSVMVVDWGGGTLDVTVLEAIDGIFMEQTSNGIQSLGGVDFDSTIMKWLAESTAGSETWTSIQRTMLRIEVEKAKVLLSNEEEVNIPLPDGSVRRLTRAEFEQITEPLLDRSRIPIERCLRDIEAISGDIDTLVLAGGTCNIPSVRKLAQDLIGIPPESGINPMTAIAEGAAVAAAIMQGELSDYEFFVSTEHSLGTLAVNPVGELEFSEIISRNHKLPAEGTESFSPSYDNQEAINFRVIEGDPEKPINHVDNVILAEWSVEIPNPGPMNEVAFTVAYKYDLDGIVQAEVTDMRDGSSLFSGEIALGVQKDKRKLVEIAKRVEETIEEGVVEEREDHESELDGEISTLVLNARNKVCPFVDDEEGTEIRTLCKRIEESSGEDTEAVQELKEITQRYNYLF